MTLEMNRRRLLQGMGIVGAASVAQPLLSSNIAYAATASYTGNILILLNLRGGFDGLSAIAPIGDADYAKKRPTLAVPASRALPTGNRMFGLHPSLASLKPFWDAGAMNAVHAVGTTNLSRSHFSSMDAVDRSCGTSSVTTGWLQRVLAAVGAGSVFEGTHLGSGACGLPFNGPINAISTDQLKSVTLQSLDWVGARMTTALSALHTGTTLPGAAAGASTISALTTVAGVVKSDVTPKNGASYPAGSTLGFALADAARLVRANVGLQYLTIDFLDWDFHAAFGASGSGDYANHLKELSDCLAAFMTDIGTLSSKVTVVTMSEFGRRVSENGSGGLDHGYGNAMLLLGGGLAGGKVLGTWPGLADAALQDKLDLAGTTDYRNVFSDILVKRCKVTETQIKTIFPGLMRSTTGALL